MRVGRDADSAIWRSGRGQNGAPERAPMASTVTSRRLVGGSERPQRSLGAMAAVGTVGRGGAGSDGR